MSSEQPPTPQFSPQPGQYPPPPQQPDPYQPQATAYQQQPGQYPQPGQYQQPTEIMAILGLIGSFVFWPAGLVLSILASKKIKKTGAQGKGLALAGLIVSCVAAAITVIYVVIGIIGIIGIIATVTLANSAGTITSSLDDLSTTAPDTGSYDNADIDLTLSLVGLDAETYKITNGEFPTDISQLKNAHTDGVDVEIFADGADGLCIQGTKDGGDTSRKYVMPAKDSSDGTCEG